MEHKAKQPVERVVVVVSLLCSAATAQRALLLFQFVSLLFFLLLLLLLSLPALPYTHMQAHVCMYMYVYECE